MVSHSWHTNHEFLILVIRVTTLVANEKVLIMMLHIKRIFLSSQVLQKTGQKNLTKILKNIRKV